MKILFAGEGGQGVQAVAEILAQAAYRQDLESLYIPNFGVEQRGGVSLAFVVVQKEPVVYPKFKEADILVVFSDRSLVRATPHLGPKTKVIFTPAVGATTQPGKGKLIRLEAGSFPPRTWNVLALGKVNQIGKIVKQEALVKAMNERFARHFKNKPELREIDLKALQG